MPVIGYVSDVTASNPAAHRSGVGYLHVAVGLLRRFFADFRGRLPIFADVCKTHKFIELIFRALWATFRISIQNLEKLDPRAAFAPRECFFRIPPVFLINLA